MIHFYANQRSAMCLSQDKITTGSVGIPVEFGFSSDWDELCKVAVFRGSGRSADVILSGTSCVVPPEVLSEAGGMLCVGVYGTDGEEIVIPTVFAEAGPILLGAEPSGAEPTPETQTLAQQILAALEEAKAIAQSVRDDADNGVFDGPAGPQGPQGPAGQPVDATLTQQGQAADAKAAGDALAAKYVKPAGGIPASDIASGVIPTVPTLVSELQNDAGYATSVDVYMAVDESVFKPFVLMTLQNGTLSIDLSTFVSSLFVNGGTAQTLNALANIFGRGLAMEFILPSVYLGGSSADDGVSFHIVKINAENLRLTLAATLDNTLYWADMAPTSETSMSGTLHSATIPSVPSDVGAVAVSQGVANAGKFLAVNSSGNVEPVTMTSWQGGSF